WFFLGCSFGFNNVSDNFTFENPPFCADDAVGSARFSCCVVNICTQCVQRHAAFTIPFATCNLGTTQAATHLDLDTFCTLAHSILHSTLHSATEHHTTLQLLSNALCYQSRIQIGLANFFDVDMNRNAHLLADFSAQLINVFALLANYKPGTSRMNCNPCSVCRTLNINATDRCTGKFFLNVRAYFQVYIQFVCVLGAISIPNRGMFFDDSQSNTVRMYFLTHNACSLTGPLL